MDILDVAMLRVLAQISLGLAVAAYIVYRYRYLLGLFSKRSHFVDIGPLTFRLKYIHSLRNPSGKLIFVWTDELGHTYEQIDPRVLVLETFGSVFSRNLRRESEPTRERYADAVKKHIGHGKGWVSVTDTDAHKYPLFRTIAFCIAHIAIDPAPSTEAITE